MKKSVRVRILLVMCIPLSLVVIGVRAEDSWGGDAPRRQEPVLAAQQPAVHGTAAAAGN